jgi:hypothetical protein
MTLVGEGLAALRGCLRLLRGDPHAFADFNVSIEGFWRSFAVVIPQAVLAYPHFLSLNQQFVEFAREQGVEAPALNLSRDYMFLAAFLVLWPVLAAILARILGVSAYYVRYIITYNWMSLPVMALAVLPSLLYLALGLGVAASAILGLIILCLSLFVSWLIARRALETTGAIAFAFALADFALTQGLFTLLDG